MINNKTKSLEIAKASRIGARRFKAEEPKKKSLNMVKASRIGARRFKAEEHNKNNIFENGESFKD